MTALQERLRANKLTQAQAARLLGVTHPRVSDLMRGKIDLFSLETLIDMRARAGANVKLSVHFDKHAAKARSFLDVSQLESLTNGIT